MSRSPIIFAAVSVLAAAGGYIVAMQLGGPATQAPLRLEPASGLAVPATDDLVGQRRPDFSLADAAGQTVSVDAFDGEVLLLNFWATWCAPCTEEMPMLSEFQRDHAAQGVRVVGIALDDPVRAQAFARELRVDYPLLFGLADAMLTGRRYGNGSGMLPYSVLVDGGGIIRWTRLGVLDRTELEAQLATLREVQGR